MITISLKDFVLNGNFGPVKIGMTRDEVVSLLGEPEGEMDFENGHCSLMYAYYEFFYLKENGVLYGIQNAHLATRVNTKTKRVNNKKDIWFSNDNVTMDIWFLKKGWYLTYKEVVQILKKEKVNYEIIERHGTLFFKFISGLEIAFDDNSGTIFYSDDWVGSKEQPVLITDKNNCILSYIGLWDMSLVE